MERYNIKIQRRWIILIYKQIVENKGLLKTKKKFQKLLQIQVRFKILSSNLIFTNKLWMNSLFAC